MAQPMMGGQMGAPVPQQMMGGQDGWALINGMKSCEIQEKIRWGEQITALIGLEIDFANQYKVIDPNGVDTFLFMETTDFCTRQMKRGSCADCVGWDVEVLNVSGGQQTKFLHMHRDFTFTFCCFNRPIVEIKDEATGNIIGKIRDPFACFDLTFGLMDPEGEVVLQAKGGCCQWGLCCQLPCGPCAKVTFDIVDAKSQESVGSVEKVVPSCCKFLLDSDINNYQVNFEGVQNPQWKAMLMVLAVFIDFRYFSETQDPSDIGSDGLIGAAAGGGFGGGGEVEMEEGGGADE